jgi:hypothetical protein
MSDKPKGMILNPSSRHLRLPSYQSLPVSLSSYNTEQNSIFRTIINKGKKLISSVSKSLFSFGFSRYLTESSDINENPLQENKTKETPCFKEKEEDLFVVGIKRPGKQFENCRKKRFTFNNIEVQTDIPYIPDCLDLKKEKMKKIQKKNDSAEELDTKGTDEDDDEVAKNPKGRNVIRKIIRNQESEKLHRIVEVNEEKDRKRENKNKEVKRLLFSDCDKIRNSNQFFEKPSESIQVFNSFSEKVLDSTQNFINPNKISDSSLFLIENTFVPQQKQDKPQQDPFATPNFKVLTTSSFESKSINFEQPTIFNTPSVSNSSVIEEKKASGNEKKILIEPKDPIKINPESLENPKNLKNDEITEPKSKNLKTSNNLFINLNDTSQSLPKSSEIPSSVKNLFSPILQDSKIIDKPGVSTEKTADQAKQGPVLSSSNPFLNINLVKGPEIPFKFGSSEYTPIPSQKSPLPETFLPQNMATNNSCPQDMEMDTPSSFNEGSFDSHPVSSGQSNYLCANFSNSPSSLFSTPLQPISAAQPIKFPEYCPSPFSGLSNLPSTPSIVQPFLSNSPTLFNVPNCNTPAFIASTPSIYGNSSAGNFSSSTSKGFSLGVISTVRKGK